jgi:hypothetical protein
MGLFEETWYLVSLAITATVMIGALVWYARVR